MLTLAIDTSARDFSLALLDDTSLLHAVDSNQSTTRQTDARASRPGVHLPIPNASVALFPALAELMKEADRSFESLDLIAVAIGPGMFTGLRIGVVAAKTLAYVHQTPLVAVNTLEVIAARAADSSGSSQLIRAVLNAQRQQLFAGAYSSEKPWCVREVEPNRILDRQQWIDQIGEQELLTGSGLVPLVSELEASEVLQLKRVRIAESSIWNCHAEGVGRIAENKFQQGQLDDFWTIEPFYFRPSAAEEVLISKTMAKRHKTQTDH